LPSLREQQHHDEIYNSIPQNTHTKPNTDQQKPSHYLLSLDMQRLNQLMNDKSEWINIQSTIKQSVEHLANVAVQ